MMKNRWDDMKCNAHHLNRGFTLIELLIALVISGIVLTGIITAFTNQQKTYRTQFQLTQLNQNMRSAMSMIVEDARMAGFYTHFDRNIYNDIDWNPLNAGNDPYEPTLCSLDNIVGQVGYQDGTDLIVLFKGGRERKTLVAGEMADAGATTITLTSLDLDGDGVDDLNAVDKKFGVMVRADYTGAEFFTVAAIAGTNVTNARTFVNSYRETDLISRADVIIYRINDANPAYATPVLERCNLGDGGAWGVVAENVIDLQLQYWMNDGALSNDPTADGTYTANDIRSVVVTMTGQVNVANVGLKQQSTSSTVRVRNIGI